MKRIVIAVALLAALVAGGIAYQTYGTGAAQSPTAIKPSAPAVPVMVAAAERQAMPSRLDVIGTAQSIANVGVKSRIDGQIVQVLVHDGQYVKTGDVLFQLDARAAEAQVHQAQAQLAKDRAQMAFARAEVKRFAPLAEKNYLSHEQFEQAQSTAAASDAAVQADQAALENAQVLLTYYTIVSPMDGRVGLVTLKTGNNVKANDVPFLSINQVSPIYVVFSVSERELPGIRAAMAAKTATMTVQPAGDSGPPIEGQIAFFDNTVDAGTGTIALRGVFENKDERLWPGQYVNVALTLSVQADALVVPQAAVQVGQKSPYVFVVRQDNTAELRPVQVGRTVNGKMVITSGLEAGDRVVIDGQLRLNNGSRVDIRSAQGKTASGSAS